MLIYEQSISQSMPECGYSYDQLEGVYNTVKECSTVEEIMKEFSLSENEVNELIENTYLFPQSCGGESRHLEICVSEDIQEQMKFLMKVSNNEAESGC